MAPLNARRYTLGSADVRAILLIGLVGSDRAEISHTLADEINKRRPRLMSWLRLAFHDRAHLIRARRTKKLPASIKFHGRLISQFSRALGERSFFLFLLGCVGLCCYEPFGVFCSEI